MTALAAYLDDSGTHVGSAWVVVAGGVASVKQWSVLSRAWGRAVIDWKLTKGYFRMTEFVNSVSDYSAWSTELKAARLNHLVEIIGENVRLLVGNAVNEADFNEAFRRFPTATIGTAYRFCAFLALPAVNMWRERSPRREPVAFIFESGNKLMNEYGQILAQIGSHQELRKKFGVASVEVGQKRNMPALQAADLIAYAAYKCMVEKRIAPPYLERAFERLFKNKTQGMVFGNPDLLEKYLRHMEDGKPCSSFLAEVKATIATLPSAVGKEVD
jgi:hypothetical protein